MMDQTLLDSILKDHKLWVESNRKEGRPASLKGRDLAGKNLSNANLCFINLEGADLEAANLENSRMHGANFKGANLNRANLRNASCTSVDFSVATLTKTNLYRTSFFFANLNKAKLTNSLFYETADFRFSTVNSFILGGDTLLVYNGKVILGDKEMTIAKWAKAFPKYIKDRPYFQKSKDQYIKLFSLLISGNI